MAILGIKTTTPSTLTKLSDLDALFSSDSDSCSFSLDFAKTPNTLPSPSFRLPAPVSSSEQNQINSLEEALPRINNFLSKLREIDYGSKLQNYIGDIYFIPENAVPIELSSLLFQLYRAIKEKNEEDKKNTYNEILSTDFSSFPETILAQLELLKFINSEKVDLDSYINTKVDSRILSLIHFALSKDQDSKVSIYHLILSIEEMLKFPILAPISAFFTDFNIQEILKQLAIELAALFPHNPILPSCIEKLSEFSPESKIALDLIPASDEDLSDDFSSDFFDNLRPNSSMQPVIALHGSADTNFLDFTTEISKPIITLTEPPTTVTYQLENGSSQMGMPFFQEWVESLRTCKYNDDFISNFMKSREPATFISKLPETADISMISYHLPIIHLLNSTSYTVIKKGAPFPELLKNEFQVHNALLHGKTANLNRSLSYLAKFSEKVSSKPKKKRSKRYSEIIDKIKPLEKLRKLPDVIQKPNNQIENALAISDFEIAIHGRSLLTLAPICKILPDWNFSSTIENNHWRAKYLYDLYTENNFSPYVSYRIAFALALNLMDRDPHLAINFIFEGLYVLLKLLPLNMTHIARYGFFLAAELFDQINAYYYSALMIDSFFINDVKDTSTSTTLARMATKNNDYLRSAFYYTQSLRQYINRKMVDESIYLSQVISTVYAENGLNNLAISLLEAMLYKSYNINFGIIPSRRQAGTLQTKKSKPLIPSARSEIGNSSNPNQQFTPDPQSLNTSLLALTLTDLLMNERMFDYAQAMLYKLQEGKDRIRRLANFMQSRFYYKQNRVQEFFDSIPKTEIKICLNRKSNPRLSILSASTFDTNASYLRMLANMCFRQRMYIDSVFWSEIIMHSTCKGSLKEFGYGNMLRGLSLYELWFRTKTKLELPTQLNKLQEPFGKFLPTITNLYTDFYSDSDSESEIPPISQNEIKKSTLFKEAMSSFYIAKQCFDRVGCFHLYIYSTLMFCDLFLHNAFELLYKKQKLNNKNETQQQQQQSMNVNIKPIKMLTELLNSNEPFQLPFQFTQFTVTLESFPTYFNAIETVISKSLAPVDIIQYQTIRARYYFLKNDIDECRRYFDYAYTNIQRYFVCGSEFLPQFFPQRKQHRIHIILEELVQLLINLDTTFINDRLIIFDILNDVRLKEANKRKSREIFSSVVISPSTDIQSSFITLSNPNYPDFQPVLSAYINHLNNLNGNNNNGGNTLNPFTRFYQAKQPERYSELEDNDPTKSINYYISQIDSNIRLFEAEKISEGDMMWKNRKLCQKIEMAAETVRRQHQTDLPLETQYSYALKINPKCRRLVFVFRVFDKIGVYSPLTGLKKVLDIFESSMMKPISLKIRGESINDSISMFNTQFLEMFLSLTSTSFSKSIKVTHARRIQKEVASMLFSSIIEFKKRPIVPDNHFLGGSRVFGKHLKGSLVTMDCGDEPLILVTTVDLACLPYETMLKRQTVIRSTSFTRLLLRCNGNIQLSGRSSIKISSANILSAMMNNTKNENSRSENNNINNNENDEDEEDEDDEDEDDDDDDDDDIDDDGEFEDYYYDDVEIKKPKNTKKSQEDDTKNSNTTKKSKKLSSQIPTAPQEKQNKTIERSSTITLTNGVNKRSATPPPNKKQKLNNNKQEKSSNTSSAKMTKSKSTSNSHLNRTSMLVEIDIEELKSVVKPMIIRSRLDDQGRAVLPLNDFIYTFGGKYRFDYSLNIEHLDESLAQPLFCSKETNEYYTQKFEFLTIVDEAKIVPILPNNLIICSYDDLCEMPAKLEKRMKDFRNSSFLFIPNIYFKEAIKEMKKIFKRHERRMRYAMTHPNELRDQLCMLADKYMVLTTMQATLIQIFNFPFPLFTPLP